MDDDLWLSMMRGSAKGHDLARDPRIVLHSVVTGPEAGAEIKLRGTVRTETSRDIQQRYADKAAAELGWRPVPGEVRACSRWTSATSPASRHDRGDETGARVALAPHGGRGIPAPGDHAHQPGPAPAGAPRARAKRGAPAPTEPTSEERARREGGAPRRRGRAAEVDMFGEWGGGRGGSEERAPSDEGTRRLKARPEAQSITASTVG